MKKLIAMVLILAVAVSAAACTSGKTESAQETAPAAADPAVVGGWSIPADAAVTEDVRAAFEKGLESLLGVNYEPVALLGSQIVAGTNYCILCRAAVVYPNAQPYYALVYLYQDLEGNAQVLNIVRIDIAGASSAGNVGADPETAAPGALAGGWSVTEDPALTSEADAAFTAATEGLLGVSYKAAALLATQVVSGTNYCFLSRAETVSADPAASWKLVYVYRNLEGAAELLNIADLDFVALSEYAAPEAEGGLGIVEDAVRDVSAAELAERTGLSLTAPEGAENVTYNVLTASAENPVAEMSFTIDGNEAFMRAQPTGLLALDDADAETFSGMYGNWSGRDTTVGYCNARLYEADGTGYVYWLDVAPGIRYAVGMLSGAGTDGADLVALANGMFDPVQGNADGEDPYAELAGSYQDSFSQRASAEVTPNGDGVAIVIDWSDSAFSYAEWTMTAAREGDRLVYSDCTKTYVTVDTNGTSVSEVESENGSGYFEIVDGSLLWTGAEEEYCRDCVFVR